MNGIHADLFEPFQLFIHASVVIRIFVAAVAVREGAQGHVLIGVPREAFRLPVEGGKAKCAGTDFTDAKAGQNRNILYSLFPPQAFLTMPSRMQ